jgi:hypothetical protein
MRWPPKRRATTHTPAKAEAAAATGLHCVFGDKCERALLPHLPPQHPSFLSPPRTMLTRTSARWPRVCAGGGYYVSILGSPRPRLRNSSSLNTGTTSPLLSPYAISAAAFPRLVPFFLGRTCYSTLSAPSSYHAHHHRSSSVSTNSSSAVYKSPRSCASAKSFSTSSTSTTSTATPSATHMASADTIRRRSGKDVAHDEHNHVHENGHNHSRDHDHSHSHSIFGGHTHSHDEGHDQNAEAVVKALKGSGMSCIFL